MPSLALDLVSHEVHIEARKERTRQTSRRMYVQEPHILTDHLDMLLHDTRYAWIRSHISKLEFTRVRVSPRKLPDWRPLVSQWPRLRTVNIQVVRLSGKFPLNIANEYCSGIARFSKGMVTSIIRELMEKSYVSELVIRVLQPDDLRYALEQNCSTYEASVRYTGIYQDESSTELFHVVYGQIYSRKEVQKEMKLVTRHEVVKAWFEEMEKDGAVEEFKTKGGKTEHIADGV